MLTPPEMKTMEDVSLAQAKDHLEELIERAAKGEDIRISDTKLGTVRLMPVRAPDLLAPRVTDTMEAFVPLAADRVPGRLKGRMKVPARLMEPMTEEELRDWYGDDA
jgi:prevent-host-death family protein